MDYLRDIGVYLCKEVCKNVVGVLGFGHFGVISIAYLGARYKKLRIVLGLCWGRVGFSRGAHRSRLLWGGG